MAVTMLGVAARKAAVPVFVVAGTGGRASADLLRLDHRIRLVQSPRHAMLLLVVGDVDPELQEPLHRVHDALPAPRATLWWDRSGGAPPPLPALTVDRDDDVGAACAQRAAALLDGSLPSEPPLSADVERHPWRGVGPYGQGGTGMTGGHPYGRALASRSDDLRDRLALDAVPVTVGPFFPALPDGLTLRVVLQGDVVQELDVDRVPAGPNEHDDVFWRAMQGRTEIRVLERERASSHLRWLGRALRLVGLPALADRALRLSLDPERERVHALVRLVARLVPAVTTGIGILPRDKVVGRGLGPVARASGAREDARTDDPAYRSVGFEPVVHDRGDVWGRWRQRLDETLQSLDLATRAGSSVTGGDGRQVEGPHGAVDADHLTPLLTLLPTWLQGSEWGDAVTVIASLDLDPDTEPAARAVPA